MEAHDVFFAVLIGVLAILSALIVLPFADYLLAAILLAFVLEPLQRRLAPAVGSKPSAFLLVVVATTAVVVPLVWMFRRLVANARQVPEVIEGFPGIAAVETTVQRQLGVELSLRSGFETAATQFLNTLTGWGPDIALAGVHFVLGVFLFVFLLYYLLTDGETLVQWLKDVTPLPADVQDRLYDEAHGTTWAVLKGHVFVAIAQGILAGLGLWAVGIPSPLFWTLVMIVLGFLPIVGVAAVWAPAAVYLVLSGAPLRGLLLAVYGITLVAAVDDYLRAVLVDRESSLHTGVILLGVLGAVYFLGPMGLFYGPIVLGLFKATVDAFDDYYQPETG